MARFAALFLALLAGAHAEVPGCKIRITSKALELRKAWGRGRPVEGGSPPGWAQALRSCCCLSEAGGTALSGARAGDDHHSRPGRQGGPLLLQHLRVSRGHGAGLPRGGGAKETGRGLRGWARSMIGGIKHLGVA